MTSKLRLGDRRGFTLIEILVVIGIIGILAAIAIPQLAVYRRNAFDTQMIFDLRNAATAQEEYFLVNGTYASTVPDLEAGGFKRSVDVTITITPVAGPPLGYTMTAVHSGCTVGSSRTFNSTNYLLGGTGCQ